MVYSSGLALRISLGYIFHRVLALRRLRFMLKFWSSFHFFFLSSRVHSLTRDLGIARQTQHALLSRDWGGKMCCVQLNSRSCPGDETAEEGGN